MITSNCLLVIILILIFFAVVAWLSYINWKNAANKKANYGSSRLQDVF